ncbi:unnamed protein product [Soboliphyme baturini]|uniref:HECT domain-containing protein n=1 Tax=Soboliphyme baturini TaxID=241478 RepID=A0A183J9M0_9BILA|nr:unnamed protein product [Soboliphyme baturini]
MRTTSTAETSGRDMCQRQSLDRSAVYALARSLSLELSFFFLDKGGLHAERFCRSCHIICQCMSRLQVSVSDICRVMHVFDYDEATIGNGYRSIVSVVDKCVLNIIRLLKFVKEHKGTILFRTGNYCKELETFCDLFPDLDKLSDLDEMMRKFESFDQSCFFGRTIGFQFCSSVCRIFRVIAISLASYSLLWERSKYSWTFVAGSLLSCGRLLLNPEERGKRIAACFKFSDPSFCKAFWELLETPLLKHIPSFFGPALHINEIYFIPGDGCIFLENSSGSKVEILAPEAYTGKRPLPVRILSSRQFDGLVSIHHPIDQLLCLHCV